jgi:glycerol-3-phosphate acyltransferase PlsY
MQLFLILIISYLLGSIPFGIIAAKFFKIDITKYGSGNIGATNVLRTLGALPGIIVLALDLLKGTLAAYLGILFLKDAALVVLCALIVVLGHMFSIFIGFKGGKGAAVGLGILLAIAPDVFIITAILVIIIIAVSRYVSLASIICPIFAVALMFLFKKPIPYLLATAAVSALMIYKHIPNIKRLMSGTERKVGETNG